MDYLLYPSKSVLVFECGDYKHISEWFIIQWTSKKSLFYLPAITFAFLKSLMMDYVTNWIE